MIDVIAKLRNPAFAPNDNRRTILHAPQVVADMDAAAAEIERLRGLVESFEQILSECENDFHRCERCDHQDDAATKESDLFILLRAAIKEQGGSGHT